MTLTTWSPVADLAGAEIERLNRMFDAAFSGAPMPASHWVPAVDVFENDKKDVVVKIDLPEMKRDDIKVTFENNLLTVEGERKLAESIERDRYHRIERGFGAFRRSLSFPSTVDASRVEAAYQDGVLTVTLPRREETRPRQIPVGG